MATYQNIKGTFDILPDAYTDEGGTRVAPSAEWRYVEDTVRDVMERFNVDEIRTPVLEPTELVARGVGEETDIVSKEMFAFERGDTQYVLRPEVTAPVMRAYLQHHLDQRGGAQKLYYIGPCFRAEQPQKGRYRQFHQFGCEVIGAEDGPILYMDLTTVETIAEAKRAFRLWVRDIEEDPSTWLDEGGWDVSRLRGVIRDWANEMGADILVLFTG